MTPEFSEFSYGLAFTHEYINRHPGLGAAPELPSLVKEGTEGGGWDLKLGYQGHPKFFQFKLSEFMRGSRALHWGQYGTPHYRFRVTPQNQSDQHNLLKDLAEDYEDVIYAAPRFHKQGQFDELFLQKRVTDNSIWVPVRDLPRIHHDERHYLTFTSEERVAQWQSEPIRLEGKFSAEDHYATVNERRTIDEEFFRELRQNLIRRLRESRGPVFQEPDQVDEIETVLNETHRLLTTQFGLQMVVLVEGGG
ncbi:MAG: hypothetical protein F4X66_00930 [Chloroflexi bacterium]|nr:hypothetical protein [Chloroflexota bacterium]